MGNSRNYFQDSLLILAVLLFCFGGIGCASKTKQQITEPPPHSHYYPLTEVMGEYHLRLIVDHYDGNMALVFEDFNEKPVKPVTFNSIKGNITFPDGTIKEQTFLAEAQVCSRYCRRYYSRKYGFPKQKGVFASEAKWIKMTPKFTLEVNLSFKGKNYQLVFQYEVPGGSIPYHRK